MEIFLLFIVSLANLLLGLLVLYNNPKNPANLSFSVLTFSLALWVLTWAMAFSSGDPISQLFWTRAMMVGASVIPSSFLYFSYVFPNSELKIKKTYLLLFFVFPSLFFLALAPSGLYIQSTTAAPWGIDFIPGPAYLWHSLFFAGYLGFAFLRLTKKLFTSRGIDKEKIKYLFIGTFVAALAGLIVNFILPILGTTKFNKYGPILTLALVGFTSYAILKKRLLDITVIIGRVAAWVLTVFFFATGYGALTWVCRELFGAQLSWEFFLISLLYGLLVAEFFPRLRLFLQTSADRTFIKGWYDYRTVHRQISSALRRAFSQQELIDSFKQLLDEKLDISKIQLLFPDKTTKELRDDELTLSVNDPLLPLLLERKGIVLHDEFPSLPAQLAAPCFAGEELTALILLGKKRSEDPYNEQDLDMLQTLAEEFSDALLRISPYEEVKKQYEATQHKLLEAEKQMLRSQRLASLGTLIAGVTHEIRNPMTVIRGKVETLFNRERDAAYLQETQKVILENIDRVESIIQHMLGMAKEKKSLQTTELNLNEIFEKSSEFFPLNNILLKKEFSPLPPVKGDADQLRQVFVNLIQNAIQAMPNGGSLTLRTYEENGRAVAEVVDTGKGISHELQEKIFDPFFSTRFEGVGLGLPIAYKIVREHGGEISLTSEPGKGTTFKVVL